MQFLLKVKNTIINAVIITYALEKPYPKLSDSKRKLKLVSFPVLNIRKNL